MIQPLPVAAGGEGRIQAIDQVVSIVLQLVGIIRQAGQVICGLFTLPLKIEFFRKLRRFLW
jgi:hypothetical protein